MVSNGHISECSGPYWSNPPFLIFWHWGTVALTTERQSAPMSEIKNGRLGLYGAEHPKCNHMMTLGVKGLCLIPNHTVHWSPSAHWCLINQIVNVINIITKMCSFSGCVCLCFCSSFLLLSTHCSELTVCEFFHHTVNIAHFTAVLTQCTAVWFKLLIFFSYSYSYS